MTNEQQEDDILELDTPVEDGEEQEKQPDPQDDDLSFVIDDDDDDGLTDRPDDSDAIRKARAAARSQARRAAEAERQLRMVQRPTQAPPDPGPFPDIEDPKFEWDATRHAAAVQDWQRAIEAKARWDSEQEQARTRAQQAEQRVIDDYRGKAAALGVKDFDAAHSAVVAAIPPETQALIGKYAKNSAQFVYALYKNPGVLARLAQQTDIAAQAVMIGELQRGMKMPAKRTAPPPPESDTIQRGTAPVSKVGNDKKLAALEEKARKTGDRTELRAYRKAKGIAA